jgi:hypothetical protein
MIPVYLDSSDPDAAGRLLGTTHPEETIECTLSLAVRMGEAVRELMMGSSTEPAQLCLLDEAALPGGAT